MLKPRKMDRDIFVFGEALQGMSYLFRMTAMGRCFACNDEAPAGAQNQDVSFSSIS